MSRLSFVAFSPRGSSVAPSVYASPKKTIFASLVSPRRQPVDRLWLLCSFSLGVPPPVPSSLTEMSLQSSSPEEGFGTRSSFHSD